MKSKNIFAVIVLAVCALMLVVAISYAYLMALVGAKWGDFLVPTRAISLLVVIGLPPLALVLGMIWVSNRAWLAGVVVIAGI